jgi:hypothetical protein
MGFFDLSQGEAADPSVAWQTQVWFLQNSSLSSGFVVLSLGRLTSSPNETGQQTLMLLSIPLPTQSQEDAPKHTRYLL